VAHPQGVPIDAVVMVVAVAEEVPAGDDDERDAPRRETQGGDTTAESPP
jgi:hypothetical protein